MADEEMADEEMADEETLRPSSAPAAVSRGSKLSRTATGGYKAQGARAGSNSMSKLKNVMTPGPGDYSGSQNVKGIGSKGSLASGGPSWRFSTIPHEETADRRVKDQTTPGPGEYKVCDSKGMRKSGPGWKMKETDKEAKYIDHKTDINNRKDNYTPGPGDYRDTKKKMGTEGPGFRISATGLEPAFHRSSSVKNQNQAAPFKELHNPGPGDYHIPDRKVTKATTRGYSYSFSRSERFS
jgi:hypothetical protein